MNPASSAVVPSPVAITPQLLAQHSITAQEYDRILAALGRVPSLTELGIYSVMWSEHCSYKSSRVHLKRLPTKSKRVVQGPGENAGIIDVGDGWGCAFKIESHNHPSYIEPFQGASTGVGGILRDIFTMGARPLAVMDSLRFGPIEPGGAELDLLAKNHSIVEGVVSGIAGYGNCFGVPNLGGETKFEPCYSGNPLVNAFALGMVRIDEIFYGKASGTGNPVIYVGAKTGRDGIHGASLLASAEFNEQSQEKRPNVQVGDPFMEKLLLEACLEAMRTGAVLAIQDMGAAGLTSSSSEMASRGGMGIEIDLARVPQRETGITPYEIMLSESQERMLLIAERGREAEVLQVFEKWGLDAVEIGQVTADKKLRVLNRGVLEAEIAADAIAEQGPVYERPIAEPKARRGGELPLIEFSARSIFTENFRRLLASPTIASKEWIFGQYDYQVRTNTRVVPGGGDAAVVRIKGTRRALALSTDGNGRWCQLNPRLGAMHAVAEAARNVACSGAQPVAATNCLNFGNPEKPEVMWQFREAIDGIAEACRELEVPITGGNVSFYNETLGRAIAPTPILGVLGILEDAERALGMGFQQDGDAIVLLDAGQNPATAEELQRELSSSEYAKVIHGMESGQPPRLNLAEEKSLVNCLLALAREGLAASAHDVSDGGLAVTLAESGFVSEGLAAQVDLPTGAPFEAELFSERGARAVISARPDFVSRIAEIAAQYAVRAERIGRVTQGEFRIQLNGQMAIRGSSESLRRVWKEAIQQALQPE